MKWKERLVKRISKKSHVRNIRKRRSDKLVIKKKPIVHIKDTKVNERFLRSRRYSTRIAGVRNIPKDLKEKNNSGIDKIEKTAVVIARHHTKLNVCSDWKTTNKIKAASNFNGVRIKKVTVRLIRLSMDEIENKKRQIVAKNRHLNEYCNRPDTSDSFALKDCDKYCVKFKPCEQQITKWTFLSLLSLKPVKYSIKPISDKKLTRRFGGKFTRNTSSSTQVNREYFSPHKENIRSNLPLHDISAQSPKLSSIRSLEINGSKQNFHNDELDAVNHLLECQNREQDIKIKQPAVTCKKSESSNCLKHIPDDRLTVNVESRTRKSRAICETCCGNLNRSKEQKLNFEPCVSTTPGSCEKIAKNGLFKQTNINLDPFIRLVPLHFQDQCEALSPPRHVELTPSKHCNNQNDKVFVKNEVDVLLKEERQLKVLNRYKSFFKPKLMSTLKFLWADMLDATSDD